MTTSSNFKPDFLTKVKPEVIVAICFFLVAPAYYHPNIGGEGLRIPNNALVWALACLLIICTVFKLSKNSQTFLYPSEFRFILLFPVLVTFSELLSGFEFTVSSVFTLLSLWILILFVLALFQYHLKQTQTDQILLIIVLSGFMQGIVGILQTHYFNPHFNYIPGLEKIGTPPYGFFQQINNQATYQVTCLIIVFHLIGNGFLLKKNHLIRILTLIFVFLAGYLVSVSGSRIGILTLFISLPLALYGQWSILKKAKAPLMFVLLMLFLGIASGYGGWEKVSQKLDVSEQAYSSSHRLGILLVSWRLFKDNPITGSGLGSFGAEWQHEKGRYLQQYPEANLIEDYVSHPHNEFVLWAVESGILGLVGLFSLIFGMMLALKHLKKRQIATYLALLLPIALHSLVELPYYTSAIHLFLSCLLVYMVMRESQLSVLSIPNVISKFLPLLSLVLLLITLKFFSHIVLANREMGFTQIPTNLPIAKSSSYYSELATGIEQKSKFIAALSTGRQDEVLEFISWGTKETQYEPSLQLFLLLSEAHAYIGDKTGLCKTVTKGGQIYPHAVQLKNAINYCSSL